VSSGAGAGHAPGTAHAGAVLATGELQHARRAELALQPSSLDAPLPGQPGTGTLADCLGEQDPRIEHMLSMHAVAAHWGELPPREQEILLMDFHGSMTQTEIGRRLGISQMHVSRLRTRALGYLRSRLLDLEEAHPDTGPAAQRPANPAPDALSGGT
jgi:RNA polymerase sigma-B factor